MLETVESARMKSKFTFKQLLGVTIVVALMLGFCIYQFAWIPRFGRIVTDYPTPIPREFSPKSLNELNSKTNVLVVAYKPLFNGIENFILKDEEIQQYCFLGKLEVLREVYDYEHEHDFYYDFFFERFGYHKEPIFVLYRKGIVVRFLEWPKSNKKTIMTEIKTALLAEQVQN